MMAEPFVESCLSVLAEMFYPRRCVGCDTRSRDVLCLECCEALPRVGEPVCGRCGLPTAFETPLCGECKDVDFAFETARAPVRYEGVAREVVRSLKYQGCLVLAARLMAPMMAAVVEERGFDALVPVPMHPSRLRRRGFNQAAVIAGSLARELYPRRETREVVTESLKVVRKVRDQVELTASGRRENVRGAFRCEGRVFGKILVVDDVFTTGSTMSECSAELLGAGASEVHAVSFCRTC